MSRWCQGTRAAVCLAVMTAAVGCQGRPQLRREPVATPPRAEATATNSPPMNPVEPRPDPAMPPAELPTLPIVPPIAEPPAAPAAVDPPAPTPLLDESLARASQIQSLVTDAMRADPGPAATEADPPSAVAEPIRVSATILDGARPEPPVALAPETRRPEPEPRPEPTPPVDLWKEGVGRLRELARRGPEWSGGDDRDWEWKCRFLGRIADPRAPTPGGSLTAALLAILDLDDSGSPDRGDRLRAVAEALEAEGPIEIREFRVCRSIQGFGDYEPADGPEGRPGQPLLLYCELAGLRYEAAGDRFRSRLRSTLDVLSAEGNDPVWSAPLGEALDDCRRRRRDYYVNYRITLPETLAPGAYRLRLTQTDGVSGQSTSASLPVVIRP